MNASIDTPTLEEAAAVLLETLAQDLVPSLPIAKWGRREYFLQTAQYMPLRPVSHTSTDREQYDPVELKRLAGKYANVLLDAWGDSSSSLEAPLFRAALPSMPKRRLGGLLESVKRSADISQGLDAARRIQDETFGARLRAMAIEFRRIEQELVGD